MEEIPTPDLAVPYAAPMLANTNAEVTPINPKKGAEAGQVSISTLMVFEDHTKRTSTNFSKGREIENQ
jgi:hypothetical protein